ncbi:inactive peptidyl-prolyl cis-trans isomerase FKBP6-like [Argiope bruennichi]|uniref:inactive peptidyl-prolyl cis-trans isomerase FKBP6-like n=1 Tax=Argiope bruennichi TaxID=94029 RepID=UPI002493FDDC|nr:inactive peptidyl-prolyl cis-trans isomerase FKBP6-like [Argiope bruennichi]
MSRLFLKKEISVQDLEKGVEFEVDEEDNNSSDDNFDDVTFDKDCELLAEYDDSVKPRFVTGVNVPFSHLKTRMTPITEDGLVLKEVLKQGVGGPIPEKSIVYIHYDAFLEGRTETFDSTRLRDKPFKFLFGDGRLLPGLEIGIQTMKTDELSRILVSSKYAFGPMGCPPRIPPNAELLYEVQVLKFTPGKDAVEFEEMAPEDQKKAPFEKIVGVYQCDNKLANELFHKKMFKPAIARYRRIVTLLEEVSVANEEEDEQRKGYLLKLYLNLAQCYLNIQNPKKAIIYADLALKIDPSNPKGLYRMGKASYLTGNYERAEHYFCKAKKYKPYENCINMAIKELEKKRKAHLDWEKMFCRRMLGSEEENGKPFQLEEPPEFVDIIDKEINKFVESDEQELHFQPTYTESQLDVVKFLAQTYNLAYVSKIMNGVKINKVVKKACLN